MVVYLVKFSACLLLFWLLYVALLERQKNHHFKRFYLLGAIVLALIIPFITITTYVEPLPQPMDFNHDAVVFEPIYANENIVNEKQFDWSLLLWRIYGIGAAIFFIRFSLNLLRLIRLITIEHKVKTNGFIYVLLEKLRIPHSFFKYIFLNRNHYESNTIPKEVLIHEETHAREWHSLDIILVEVLQIVLWFHPLVYILKHHIKLNHEFLADQHVLDNGTEIKDYQNMIINFSSNSSHSQLVSTINYSSIKKRLTVMKSKTSRRRVIASSILLLPIIVILIVGFSNKKAVERPISEVQLETSSVEDKPLYARSIEVSILTDDTYVIDGINATKDNFVQTFNQLHQDLTAEERNKVLNIHVTSPKKITNEEVWFIYNALDEYGFYRIVTPNQVVNKAKGNWPFKINDDSTLEQNPPTKKEIIEYNAWAKKMKAEFKKRPKTETVNGHPYIINDETFRYNNSIYKRMTSVQKSEAESMPEAVLVTEWPMPNVILIDSIPSRPISPTQKDIEDYNTWAKKINAEVARAKKNASYPYPIIKLSEVNRYKGIYNSMTEAQQKALEPFPKGPPPPPPAPQKTSFKTFTLNNIIVKGNTKYETKDIIAISKLKRGDRMLDGGEKIALAVRELWNSNLFEKVEVYPVNINGTRSDIEIYVSDAPQGKKEDITPTIYVNGKAVKNANIQLPKAEIAKLSLTLSEGSIANFKLKIPGVKTDYIEGNTISKTSIGHLDKLRDGDVITIFDIKDDKNLKLPPLLITVTDTSPKKEKQLNLKKGIPAPDGPKNMALLENTDYASRFLMIKASKKQIQPLLYKLNGKTASVDELVSYLEEDPTATVTFTKGKTNVLEFSRKSGRPMSNEELQTVYSQLFQLMDKSTNSNTVYYQKVEPSKGGPNASSDFTVYNSELRNTYLQKYKQYEALRYARPHFLKKSKADKKLMDALWLELRQLYFFSLPESDKKGLKLPITPFAPYVKVNYKGKSYYKVNEHLTEEEQKAAFIGPLNSSNNFNGLDLLEEGDPIIIPIGNYKLDTTTDESKSKRRKVFISISKNGDYAISKDDNLKVFQPITTEQIEFLLKQMTQKDIDNTFVFAKSSDFKSFRSKPSDTPEYQDDIEVILVKDDIRFPVMEYNGKYKEHTSYQLVLNNTVSENEQIGAIRLARLFKRYGITNMSI